MVADIQTVDTEAGIVDTVLVVDRAVEARSYIGSSCVILSFAQKIVDTNICINGKTS